MRQTPKPIRLLHTADIHLEARFSNLPAAKRKQRRLGLRSTFSRLIDMALKYKVDVMVVSGDLFDNPYPTKDTVTFVLAEMNRLAEKDIPLLLIPGNHDYYDVDSIFGRLEFPQNVHVFKDDTWERFNFSNEVTFLGIACHEFSSKRNVLSEINRNPLVPGKVVLLLHGSLDYGFYDGEQCYPFTIDDINNAKVDYLALGHYHNSTLSASNSIACYPGSPEGLKFSEMLSRRLS